MTLGRAPVSPFLELSGRTIDTNDVLAASAGLPTLFAFFKNTCPTCKLAWPYLERLHERDGGRGVRIVGVSQNDAKAARTFYSEFGGARFDLLLDPGPGFPASNAFDVEAVPHFVLVDEGGMIRRTSAGWSRKEMESLAREIASATGAAATSPLIPPEDPVRDFQAG